MTKAEKFEINKVYEDCLVAVEDYKLSEEGADLINQVWIEALEWVIQIEKQLKEKVGYTIVQASFRKGKK